MKTVSIILLALTLLLSACGTPGSLKSDRRELTAAYAQVKPEGELTIIFDELPGTVGDSVCTGPGMWSSASLDASSVALVEAKEVFKCGFEYVMLVVAQDKHISDFEANASGNSWFLRLKVGASTSGFSGAHVATIKVRAFDEKDQLLFEYSDEETVYDALQFGQVDTMQRAFIRIYRRTLDRLLTQRAAGAKPDAAASTAK